MQAVRLTRWERPPELCDVPEPVPGPGAVLLRVAGAGLCHSDLHLMHWPAGSLPYELPFTLGHEVAGMVVALGAGAQGVAVGDSVLVYGPWGCGVCRRCSRGEEHLCQRPTPERGCGLGRDGGLAEYLVVPSPRLLVPLDGLDPVTAAPLADAALTPYHAIRRALPHLEPGASAVVIGIGGLGHVAVQLLAALTSTRVVAVDVRPEALELARAAGAAEAVLAEAPTPGGARAGAAVGDAVGDELRRAVAPGGAGLVIDCVGSAATLALAGKVVAPGGHVAIIGMLGETFPMRRGGVPMETTVVISNWGTRAELYEVVALARAGAIRLEVEPVALSDVVAAYERLERGEVRGRVVAAPNGGEAA
jgi:propanol-preferring alcohol dehydrogenase